MNNADMKVTDLLKQKSEIENEMARVSVVIDSLRHELQRDSNFRDGGTVSIYADRREFRFSANIDVMFLAAETMLERQQEKLTPILKKLDAIELMLS